MNVLLQELTNKILTLPTYVAIVIEVTCVIQNNFIYTKSLKRFNFLKKCSV